MFDKLSTLDAGTKSASAITYYFPELGSQVEWNRGSDMNDAPGSIFYATQKASGIQFVNYLKNEVFTRPALPPAIGWKKAEEQALVENWYLVLIITVSQRYFLRQTVCFTGKYQCRNP